MNNKIQLNKDEIQFLKNIIFLKKLIPKNTIDNIIGGLVLSQLVDPDAGQLFDHTKEVLHEAKMFYAAKDN
jgi:hypothetical protein